jgi:hypothetical protein
MRVFVDRLKFSMVTPSIAHYAMWSLAELMSHAGAQIVEPFALALCNKITAFLVRFV